MSDVGGSLDINGVNLTFDSTATTSLIDEGQIVSGTYQPMDFLTGDTFNAPAPAGPYQANLGLFNGTNPNGAWQLYVFDDGNEDLGAIANGWQLNILTQAPTLPTITLAVAPGSTVSLVATDDTTAESPEFAFLRLTNATNATLGTQDLALWQIQDNDFSPTVQFSQASFSVNEGAGNGTLTLVRTGTLTNSSQVQVRITGGSATAGQDFNASNFPLNVTFAANESIKTVSIPITNDTVIESTELVLFELIGVSNTTVGTQDFTTLRILDNDASTLNSLPAPSSNQLIGTSKKDVITSNDEDNVIVGGYGKDKITGGEGADRFVYTSIEDGRDTIADFDVDEDRIDLSQIFASKNYDSSNPFSDYVRLKSLGSGTAIEIAPNGDEFSSRFKTLAVLENIVPSELTASNFLSSIS